jgi:hypothetical protein
MTKAKKSTSTNLTCPECGKSDFRDPRALGTHRRIAHGVPGSSPSVLSARRAAAQAAKAGKAAKPRKTHQRGIEEPQEAPAAKKVVAVPLQVLGYAVGKLESLAEEIAQQNDLPSREFLTRCAQSLLVLAKH